MSGISFPLPVGLHAAALMVCFFFFGETHLLTTRQLCYCIVVYVCCQPAPHPAGIFTLLQIHAAHQRHLYMSTLAPGCQTTVISAVATQRTSSLRGAGTPR